MSASLSHLQKHVHAKLNVICVGMQHPHLSAAVVVHTHGLVRIQLGLVACLGLLHHLQHNLAGHYSLLSELLLMHQLALVNKLNRCKGWPSHSRLR